MIARNFGRKRPSRSLSGIIRAVVSALRGRPLQAAAFVATVGIAGVSFVVGYATQAFRTITGKTRVSKLTTARRRA